MSSGNFGRWQLAPPDSQQQRAPDWLSQHTYGYSQHTCPNKWTQGNLCEHTRQGSQPQTYPLVPTQPQRDSRSESQQMHRGIQRKAARSVLPKDQHASLTWPSAHYCGSRHSKVTTIHRSTSQEEQWHNEELHHFLEGLNRKTLQACIGIAARKSGTSNHSPHGRQRCLSLQYQGSINAIDAISRILAPTKPKLADYLHAWQGHNYTSEAPSNQHRSNQALAPMKVIPGHRMLQDARAAAAPPLKPRRLIHNRFNMKLMPCPPRQQSLQRQLALPPAIALPTTRKPR